MIEVPGLVKMFLFRDVGRGQLKLSRLFIQPEKTRRFKSLINYIGGEDIPSVQKCSEIPTNYKDIYLYSLISILIKILFRYVGNIGPTLSVKKKKRRQEEEKK